MRFPKLQEFIYSISTNDKYSEFDSLQSFNRINKPESETLLHTDDLHMSEEYYNALEGIHEVKLAWRHIKNWLVRYLPDLESSLQDKCTDADLAEFQKDLNIKLPACVAEFYKMTDGQGNFGTEEVQGLVFGLVLMPLDGIVTAAENWRKISNVLAESEKQRRNVGLSRLQEAHCMKGSKKLTETITMEEVKSEMKRSVDNEFILNEPSHDVPAPKNTNTGLLFGKQTCIPPGCVHQTFAHPMWIPILTDEVGNYIGIDLSPPPHRKEEHYWEGRYGQVILFGREFDTKFRIADNFGDFLLMFANDLEKGNWEIVRNRKNNDGDLFLGNEATLVYVDKTSRTEMPYLEVLRQRCINDWVATVKKSNEIPPEIHHLMGSVLEKKKLAEYRNPVDQSINSNIAGLVEKEFEGLDTLTEGSRSSTTESTMARSSTTTAEGSSEKEEKKTN